MLRSIYTLTALDKNNKLAYWNKPTRSWSYNEDRVTMFQDNKEGWKDLYEQYSFTTQIGKVCVGLEITPIQPDTITINRYSVIDDGKLPIKHLRILVDKEEDIF